MIARRCGQAGDVVLVGSAGAVRWRWVSYLAPGRRGGAADVFVGFDVLFCANTSLVALDVLYQDSSAPEGLQADRSVAARLSKHGSAAQGGALHWVALGM